MQIEQAAKDLELISKYLGSRVDYVQAGGGNTSVKLNGKNLLVKASGVKLKDVSATYGFVSFDFAKYRSLLAQNLMNCSEEEYTQFGIDCMTSPSMLRPSIETCFHSLIDQTHIIHSHSVYANVLLCSQNCKQLIETIIPEALLIPYATPGKDLAKKIIEYTSVTTPVPRILFLQNHGIIVCADSAQECIALHESVNEKIKNALNLSEDFTAKKTDNLPILFPDQAVYSKDQTDVFLAAGYILEQIEKAHLSASPLSQPDTDIILNLESEKHRKKMAQS